MTQQRLKAYLSLIQELLTCPNGEEWIRLRQHEDLVDAGLVQTMEQVATTLAQEGKRQEAIFLHNWAGQLHHIIAQSARPAPEEETSDPYLDFIQALLDASPPEQQRLIAENPQLVTPRLVHLMRQISAQLAAQGDRETAAYLNRLAEHLGKLWLQHHEFDHAATPNADIADNVEVSSPAMKSPFKLPFEKRTDSAGTLNGQTTSPTSPSASAAKPTTMVTAPDFPDLWLEPFAKEPEPVSAQAESEPVTPPSETAIAPETPAVTENSLGAIETHLATIAAALIELSEQLAHTAAPSNPLGHLEALEKAHQAGWILTTEEVEALLHVRPHCSGTETTFERGCWRLVKVGKVGSQIGWRVEKAKVPVASI